jgi:AP endonuclease-2
MKLSRATLDYTWALPGQFDGFFSFPINKGGYSGVAVYTNSFTVVPIKAEEGITGKVQPKPPLTSEERVSSLYPSAGYMGCLMHGEDGIVPSDLTYLDTEGRALVLDFGLFVLINTYCPNLTSDARMSYKMNFVYTLRERVRLFISEGREVIVLGDLNICSSPLDHADGNLASNASTWYDDRPDRILLRQWIDEEDGCMVDILRKLWPQRKGMFTCSHNFLPRVYARAQ